MEPVKQNSILNWFTLVIMGLNTLVILITLFLLFFPTRIAEVYNEPFPVTPQTVARGESVSIEVEFEKFNDYQVTSNRNIICDDGNLVTLAPVESSAPLGRHTVDVQIQIPHKTSLGSCYVEFDNVYHINPLRNEHRKLQTQPFNVIE